MIKSWCYQNKTKQTNKQTTTATTTTTTNIAHNSEEKSEQANLWWSLIFWILITKIVITNCCFARSWNYFLPERNKDLVCIVLIQAHNHYHFPTARIKTLTNIHTPVKTVEITVSLSPKARFLWNIQQPIVCIHQSIGIATSCNENTYIWMISCSCPHYLLYLLSTRQPDHSQFKVNANKRLNINNQDRQRWL